jgi:hypothetical protein
MNNKRILFIPGVAFLAVILSMTASLVFPRHPVTLNLSR